MRPKQTRNRAKQPAWSYNGLDSTGWRSVVDLVQWAQTAPQFRDLMTVMTNERRLAAMPFEGLSEARLLGRVEGFQTALNVLLTLPLGLTPETKIELEPTYPAEPGPQDDWRD